MNLKTSLEKGLSLTIIILVLLNAQLPVSTFAQTSSGSNLIAYWSFDEGNGINAADYSGNNFDGQLENGPSWTTDGVGGCLFFDGVNDVVRPPISIFSDPDQLSFEARIMPTELRDSCIVMSGSGGHISLNYLVDGRFEFCVWHPDVTWSFARSSPHPINAWYHVVGVWSELQYLRIYVNGVEEGIATETKVMGNPGNNYPFMIGAYSKANEKFYKGYLDEVSIYDEVLTDSEITTFYTVGHDYDLPTAPNRLAASSTNTTITLTWTESAFDGGLPIIHHIIYRGTSAGNETYLNLAGDSLTYIDSAVESGRQYYYRVSAVNSLGEGPQSNEVQMSLKSDLGINAFPLWTLSLIMFIISTLIVIIIFLIVKLRDKPSQPKDGQEPEAKEMPGNTNDRLANLDRLKNDGLITDEEYFQKRSMLLRR